MKGKFTEITELLQLELLKITTSSPSIRYILRGAGATLVLIFGSAFKEQPTLFSTNFLMMMLGFFLVFTPYIFSSYKKQN
ncbi:hypothetical protein [Bacillus paralicheniformis]|uniref:hypothetical protein n=1 Tax=Bacillus paralicheniformis TaxID=1648923 RepID=UPI0013227D29|nr:hypothetical protein [Bacillus paralicheniformis]MPQ26953.1 hypothetical protein [Bacillus paralicheniformis]